MDASVPANLSELIRTADGLMRRGRGPDAAQILARALERAPTDAGLDAAVARVVALSRSILTLGQAAFAEASLRPLSDSPHAHGDVLGLHGRALMALGRTTEAERVFRRWVDRDPNNDEAGMLLAAVLADHGDPKEAEGVVRALIATRGSSAPAAFVLGRALLAQARFGEAEAAFRAVVAANPAHQIAQSNLMELVWMRTGDADAAGQALDEALRAQPALAGLRITKARLLAAAGGPRAALAEIDVGLATAPRNAALLESASAIALDFDGARALAYATRLHAIAPQARAARVALGNASLATGRGDAALAIADSLHRDDLADGRALAMRADALRMLGDPHYRELLDYTHLVSASLLDVPAGWSSLEGYLADLARDLDHAHTLHAHPLGNSLRGGSQVSLVPARSPFDSIRAFPQAIDAPIRRYLQAIGHADDPMRRRNTGSYAVSGMWSVRLRPNGFHVNHYHPQGWISSACYLHLPSAVAGGSGEGWLKFGEPAFPTTPVLGPEYVVKPAPGLLVLFPSYMWHGTRPFAGGDRDTRLTVAFDVVPRS